MKKKLKKPIDQTKVEQLTNELKKEIAINCEQLIGAVQGGDSVLLKSGNVVVYCSHCNQVQVIPNGLDNSCFHPADNSSRSHSCMYYFTCPACASKSIVYQTTKVYGSSKLSWDADGNAMVAVTGSSDKYPLINDVKIMGFDTIDIKWFIDYKARASENSYSRKFSDETNYIELYRDLCNCDDGMDVKCLKDLFEKLSCPEERVFAYLLIRSLPRAYYIMCNAAEPVRNKFEKFLSECSGVFSTYSVRTSSISEAEKKYNQLRLLINSKFTDYNEVFHVPFKTLQDIKDLEKADAARKMLKKLSKSDDVSDNSVLLKVAGYGSRKLSDNVGRILSYGYTKPEEIYNDIITQSLLTGYLPDQMSGMIADYQSQCRNHNVMYAGLCKSQSFSDACNVSSANRQSLRSIEMVDEVHYYRKWYEGLQKVVEGMDSEKMIFLANGDMAELIRDIREVYDLCSRASISGSTMFYFMEQKSAYLYISALDDVVYVVNDRQEVLLERKIA